jgi:hypothetical protein
LTDVIVLLAKDNINLVIYILSRDDRRPTNPHAWRQKNRHAAHIAPGVNGDGVKNLARLARLATIHTTTSPPRLKKSGQQKRAAYCAALYRCYSSTKSL